VTLCILARIFRLDSSLSDLIGGTVVPVHVLVIVPVHSINTGTSTGTSISTSTGASIDAPVKIPMFS
jgi:hypothetical protein